MVKKNIKAVVNTIKERIDAGQKEGEAPPWVKQVAMLTGVLAAVSGFLAVRATTLTNDAIYQSNQAILAQNESSDAWSEYQANSIKAHIVETAQQTAGNLSPAHRKALEDEGRLYRDRQPDIKKTATDKAAERDLYLQAGSQNLAEKDLLGYAEVAAQVGIALASVAALVRMRLAFYFGIAAGLGAIILTGYAFAAHYHVL